MQDLQLLTCNEVARILRVSTETVRQLAASGELPGRKVGRAWRFLRSAVATYCLIHEPTSRGWHGIVEVSETESDEEYMPPPPTRIKVLQ